MIIRRVLEQKCVGFSADYQLTYYSGRAEMDTGEIRDVYLIDDGRYSPWCVGTCPRPAFVTGDYREES